MWFPAIERAIKHGRHLRSYNQNWTIPRPGQTKTRLMPYLSGDQGAELHWAFLRDLSNIYAFLGVDLLVAHTPDPDWDALKAVFPDAFFFPQEGTDLGAKMNHALNLALSMGYDKCILTGSDLPLMTKDHLMSGFEALENADTYRKLQDYLQPDFLENLLVNYVRRDFLKG